MYMVLCTCHPVAGIAGARTAAASAAASLALTRGFAAALCQFWVWACPRPV